MSAAIFMTSSTRGVSFEDVPSVPRATLTPASQSLRNGAMPAISFMFEIGLCETLQPLCAMSSMSSSVAQTEWAIVVRSVSAPTSCR